MFIILQFFLINDQIMNKNIKLFFCILAIAIFTHAQIGETNVRTYQGSLQLTLYDGSYQICNYQIAINTQFTSCLQEYCCIGWVQFYTINGVQFNGVDNNIVGLSAQQENKQPLFHYRGNSLNNYTITVPIELGETWREIIEHWVLHFDPYNTPIQQQSLTTQQTEFQSQGQYTIDGLNSYGQYQHIASYNTPYSYPDQPQQSVQSNQQPQPLPAHKRASNFKKTEQVLNLVLQGVSIIDPQLGASISSAVQFGEQAPRLISMIQKIAAIISNGHTIAHKLSDILQRGLNVGEQIAGRISKVIIDKIPKITHHIEKVVHKIIKKLAHAAKKAFEPRTYSHAIRHIFKHLFAQQNSKLLASNTKVLLDKRIYGKDLKLTLEVKTYLVWDQLDHFIKWEGSLLYNFFGEERKVQVLNFNATVGNQWSFKQSQDGRIKIDFPIRLHHPFSFIVLDMHLDVNYTVGLDVNIKADDSGYPFKFDGHVQVTTNAVTDSTATFRVLGMKAGLLIKGQLFNILIHPSVNLDYNFENRQVKVKIDWYYEFQKSVLQWGFFWANRKLNGEYERHDADVKREKTYHEVWKILKKEFSEYL